MSKDGLLKPPPDDKPRPTPAPAWVAFVAVWLGVLSLLATLILLFLPGSKNPRAELERIRAYSAADRFFPVPVYLSVVAMFMGILVFWQMRREPRPLPDAMNLQRAQAGIGMALTFIAIIVFYVFAAFRAGAG